MSTNTITGTARNDALVGTQSADRIEGLGGDDTLSGHRDDTMWGGEGGDLFLAMAGGTQVADFAAADSLRVAGTQGAWRAERADGETILTRNIEGGTGGGAAASPPLVFGDALPPEPTSDVLVLTGDHHAFLVSRDAELGTTLTTWDGAAAGDVLMMAGLDARAVTAGGDDSLFGSDLDDEMRGGAGADLLDGGAGADLLVGGGGADVIHGGAGADVIYGDGGAGA